MLYHAIPCIINNCWRSVPLPCGQYNGHFLQMIVWFVSHCVLPFTSWQTVLWFTMQGFTPRVLPPVDQKSGSSIGPENPRAAKVQKKKKKTVKFFMLSLSSASREALKWCWSFEYFDRSDGTVSLIKLYILSICAAPPLTSRWPFSPPWNLNELGFSSTFLVNGFDQVSPPHILMVI